MDLSRDKVVSQVISRLAAPGRGAVKVEGTWGSFARLLAAHVAKTAGRLVLYVCPHIDDADRAVDDLRTFEAGRVELLPAWEGEEELADATDEPRAERLRLVSLVSSLVAHRASREGHESVTRAERPAPSDVIIVAPVQAWSAGGPAGALAAGSLHLAANATVDPEKVVEWLGSNSFERVDAVDLPGQFARRGGIIDIYAPLIRDRVGPDPHAGPDGRESGQSQAIRIEFFGDTVESIRQVDLDTQRSTHEIASLGIVGAACGAASDQRELFTHTLPDDAMVVLEKPLDVERSPRSSWPASRIPAGSTVGRIFIRRWRD
jgi:transcription-repair coupling factor (superfamily II helicase)